MITHNKLQDPDCYHIISHSRLNKHVKSIMSLCPQTGNANPFLHYNNVFTVFWRFKRFDQLEDRIKCYMFFFRVVRRGPRSRPCMQDPLAIMIYVPMVAPGGHFFSNSATEHYLF